MKLSLALTTAARMLGSVTFSTAHNRDTGLDPAGLSPGHGHHEASKNAETTKPRRRVPMRTCRFIWLAVIDLACHRAV